MTGTWAIVPVKGTPAAKTRLAAELNPEQRRRLMRWMVAGVLDSLAGLPGLQGVVVVGELVCDTVMAPLIRLADPGRGPNDAVTEGLMLLQERGADAAMVVAGDLPVLQAADLKDLLEAGRAAGVALAPDRHGTGTNAVYLRLPTTMRTSFGPGSLARHVAAARVLGFEPRVVRREGLALDVDEREDLEILRRLRPEVDRILGTGSSQAV
ncbi:MAG: 2-phospho-L-lactate guanylyltransferase [Xanthomonadales bacterium]|nr:2-phospho-L-lactate guanylyltransferase [Xanthomonadales bacterium]